MASASFRGSGRFAPGPPDRPDGCISFVTLGELTKWTVLRSWGPRKRPEMAGRLGNVVIRPYSEAVASPNGRKTTDAL